MGILNITRKGKKQGENMATLEELNTEAESLTGEIRACERAIRDEDSSVDAIQAAMTRKAAIEVRLGAVRNKMGLEHARIKEEQRAARQAEGEAMKDAVNRSMGGLIAPMVALFNSIGQIHEGLRAADALLAAGWNKPYPYNAMSMRSLPMMDLRVSIGKHLVSQSPDRFQWTEKGLVDKQGEAK